jgi:hypothetical protein
MSELEASKRSGSTRRTSGAWTSPVHRLQGRPEAGSSEELWCLTLSGFSFTGRPVRRSQQLGFQKSRLASSEAAT